MEATLHPPLEPSHTDSVLSTSTSVRSALASLRERQHSLISLAPRKGSSSVSQDSRHHQLSPVQRKPVPPQDSRHASPSLVLRKKERKMDRGCPQLQGPLVTKSCQNVAGPLRDTSCLQGAVDSGPRKGLSSPAPLDSPPRESHQSAALTLPSMPEALEAVRVSSLPVSTSPAMRELALAALEASITTAPRPQVLSKGTPAMMVQHRSPLSWHSSPALVGTLHCGHRVATPRSWTQRQSLSPPTGTDSAPTDVTQWLT